MASLARDLFVVLRALPSVESARRRLGPLELASAARARGEKGVARGERGRAQLRRVIAAVDRCFLDGGNCYRRALLEMSVDPAAAADTLHLGLRSHGGPRSGHAWLSSWPPDGGSYDAQFSV